MTTHRYVGQTYDEDGVWTLICSCGWIGMKLTVAEARQAFERHRARSRGRTRRPRPK